MRTLRLACSAVLVSGLAACGGGGGNGTGPPGGSAVFTSVSIAPATTSMTEGDTRVFTATPLNQSGDLFPGTATRAWSSNAPAIASVNATSGLVTALAAGTANISAAVTIGGVTKTGVASVEIVPLGTAPNQATVVATLASSFDPTPVTVASGGTVTFQFLALAHTVTFTSTGSPASIGASSNVTTDRTFPTAGTFDYHCTIHAGMEGRVIVQ